MRVYGFPALPGLEAVRTAIARAVQPANDRARAALPTEAADPPAGKPPPPAAAPRVVPSDGPAALAASVILERSTPANDSSLASDSARRAYREAAEAHAPQARVSRRI